MPLEGYLQRVLIVTLGSYLPMVFVQASHCGLGRAGSCNHGRISHKPQSVMPATGSAGRHPRTLPVQTRTQISQFCIARAPPPKEGGLARYSSQPSNERDELNHALLRNAPAVRCWRRNWRRRNDHLVEPRIRRRRQKSCHLNIEPDGVVPWCVKVQRKVRHIYKFLNRLPCHTNPSSNVRIELSISS